MNTKRLIALILAVLTVMMCLSGCFFKRAIDKKPEPTQILTTAATEPTMAIETTAVPETTVPVLSDTAQYTVEKKDHSIYDDASGKPLINLYYEQVVLEGDSEEIADINERITADYEEYLESLDSEYFKELATSGMATTEYPFINACSAEVVNNAGGIFSIKISTAWHMGGVYNGNYYGLTYNLYTGKELDITDIVDMSKASLQSKIQDAVKDYFRNNLNNDVFDDAYEVLDRYSLEDYLFYVDNGELVVTFPTYTFAAGAAGATTVYSGIYTVEDINELS